MRLLQFLRRFNVLIEQWTAHSPKLIFVVLLIGFLKLAESVQRAPTTRLLENVVFSQYYFDDPDVDDIEESMFKMPIIQSKLAHLRGFLNLLDTVPGTSSIPICLFNAHTLQLSFSDPSMAL